MPINRTPLQQAVHNLGTQLRRVANTPDWSDDALCPSDTGDHGVVVTKPRVSISDLGSVATALRGQRINPDDHTKTVSLDASDPRPCILEFTPPTFDVDIVSELNDSLKWVTAQQVAQAIAESPWSHEHDIPEDVGFWAVDDDLLREHIGLITSKDIAYTLCSADDPQTGLGCFVCRNYKTEFLSQYARLTGSDSAGGVLDIQGHHAYNVTVTVSAPRRAVSRVVYRVWEPQAVAEVKEPNLARHYSGYGIVTIGS